MNRLVPKLAGAIGGLMMGIMAGGAQAALLGATVDISARYPTAADVYQDAGTSTVSNAVEYPAGSLSIYNPSWQIDVTDTSIIITDMRNIGLPFSGGVAFNGFVLRVISGPVLTGASVDGASAFTPGDLSIIGGDTLEINFVGVSGPSTGSVSSIIDISTTPAVLRGPFVVPEPASAGLLGCALLGP